MAGGGRDAVHRVHRRKAGCSSSSPASSISKTIDLSRYADRTVPLDVILGRERTQRSQVVKQADIVALLALLPEECDARARLANFQYYEPRCGHGSSLSRGMHALVAARLGEMDLATRYFQETAATDLADIADGSAGGVHIAALGGLWQAAVFGFGGLSLRADALGLDPTPAAGLADAWFPHTLARPFGPDQDRSGS